MLVPVYLESAGCESALVDRVVSLARIELGEVVTGGLPAGRVCRVRLECKGESVVIAATLP